MSLHLSYRIVREATIVTGSLLILFLWLSARNSDDIGYLLLFLFLDQLNSRFAIKWQERLHGEQEVEECP